MNDLTIEAFSEGDGSRLGRFYIKRNGKKEYLSDFEAWLCEDLLPAEGRDFANGIYRELT